MRFDLVLEREPQPPEWLAEHEGIIAVRDQDSAADYDERAAVVAWRKKEGLPVDEAVIEQVLALGASGLDHPGMWETPQESARRRRGEAMIAHSRDAVDAYVEAHADTHAGSWIEWRDNEPDRRRLARRAPRARRPIALAGIGGARSATGVMARLEALSRRPARAHVHYHTNSAYTFERVEAGETPDQVRITVFEGQPNGVITLAGAVRSATVRLEQPAGTRRIVDAVTQRPRRPL